MFLTSVGGKKVNFFVRCVLNFIFLVTQARTNGLEGGLLPALEFRGGGKLEKNPILWLAVTQGMGQGRVRGERMTLVAWRPSLILLKVKLTLDNLAYPIESKYVCTSLAV